MTAGVDPAPSATPQEAGAGALSHEQERRAGAIARQTMSPFCPGRTLADCPSNYAAEWRADIRDMVARGMSSSEIQRELEARAGGNLSGSPNRDASYGLPIVFGVLAFSLLGAVLLRLRRAGDRGDSKPSRRDTSEASLDGASPDRREKQSRDGPHGKAESAVDDARLDAELSAEGGGLED